MTTAWRRAPALLALVAAAACGDPGGAAPPPPAPATGDIAAFWTLFRQAGESRRRGDRDGALLGYESAMQLQPGHADSLYYIAQLRYERGEVRLARERLHELADLEPRGVRVWQQLSVVDGAPLPGWMPDLAGAATAAALALQLHPSESRNHYLAARWAAYAGDGDAASDALEVAFGHNPRLWPAHLLRIWMTAGRGDIAAAAGLRDDLERQMCGDDGARCATFDPVREMLAAAATAPAASIAEASLAGAARSVDIDSDGTVDARVVLGADNDVLVLPATAAASPRSDGPRPVPLDGVALSGADQPALVLVSGGDEPVRAYAIDGNSYRPHEDAAIAVYGNGLTLPAIAAGDIDGDGLDDVLLANLPRSDGALVGRLLRGVPGGRFEPVQDFPGPLSAAHIADLDGDGDLDLLLAHDARAILLATSVLERAIGSDPPDTPPAPLLALWRNHDGELRASGAALPALWSPVTSIATLDVNRDGLLDLLVATGGLAPERPAPDRLWLQTAGGFADASDRLGDAAFGATQHGWPDTSGAIVLVRGGLVPGDSRRLVRVEAR